MHLSFLTKKIIIIERYICGDGEMKNNFRNNISSMLYKINHTLYYVTN